MPLGRAAPCGGEKLCGYWSWLLLPCGEGRVRGKLRPRGGLCGSLLRRSQQRVQERQCLETAIFRQKHATEEVVAAGTDDRPAAVALVQIDRCLAVGAIDVLADRPRPRPGNREAGRQIVSPLDESQGVRPSKPHELHLASGSLEGTVAAASCDTQNTMSSSIAWVPPEGSRDSVCSISSRCPHRRQTGNMDDSSEMIQPWSSQFGH